MSDMQRLARAQRPRRRWPFVLGVCLLGLLLLGIGLLLAAEAWFGMAGYVDDIGGGMLLTGAFGLTILLGLWFVGVRLYR